MGFSIAELIIYTPLFGVVITLVFGVIFFIIGCIKAFQIGFKENVESNK